MAEYKYVLAEFEAQYPQGHRTLHANPHEDGLGMDVTVHCPPPSVPVIVNLPNTGALATLKHANNSAVWSIRFKDWSKEKA